MNLPECQSKDLSLQGCPTDLLAPVMRVAGAVPGHWLCSLSRPWTGIDTRNIRQQTISPVRNPCSLSLAQPGIFGIILSIFLLSPRKDFFFFFFGHAACRILVP